MKKLFLISSFFIINLFCLDIEYTPFKSENVPNNTIFGTGNRLKDLVYKLACEIKCFPNHIKTSYANENNIKFCCQWIDDLKSINCAEKEQCEYLDNLIKNYLITLVFSIYFSLMIITMSCIFFIFFYISQKSVTKSQAVKNGLVAAILVFLSAFIFPILILKIICLYKNLSMTKILGGEFSSVSMTQMVVSFKLKDSEKTQKIKDEGMKESAKLCETDNVFKFQSSDTSSVKSSSEKVKKLNIKDDDRL
jgi:hypothetical protein